MQLTPPSPEQTWNWKENVRGGGRSFNGKVRRCQFVPW